MSSLTKFIEIILYILAYLKQNNRCAKFHLAGGGGGAF